MLEAAYQQNNKLTESKKQEEFCERLFTTSFCCPDHVTKYKRRGTLKDS